MTKMESWAVTQQRSNFNFSFWTFIMFGSFQEKGNINFPKSLQNRNWCTTHNWNCVWLNLEKQPHLVVLCGMCWHESVYLYLSKKDSSWWGGDPRTGAKEDYVLPVTQRDPCRLLPNNVPHEKCLKKEQIPVSGFCHFHLYYLTMLVFLDESPPF
jgi:hypothetical protein